MASDDGDFMAAERALHAALDLAERSGDSYAAARISGRHRHVAEAVTGRAASKP